MRLHRSCKRLIRIGPAGYSLVEVIVAMLIACVMVTAVMGVAVTSKQGSAKGMHRMMFDQGIAQLSSQVKQYVTACGCLKNGGGAKCPAPACTQIPGPNTFYAPNDARTWDLNGSGGTIVDSRGDVWALDCAAPHVITGVVPTLETAYNGSISYTVTWPSGCNASVPSLTDVPQISFTATWTEK